MFFSFLQHISLKAILAAKENLKPFLRGTPPQKKQYIKDIVQKGGREDNPISKN